MALSKNLYIDQGSSYSINLTAKDLSGNRISLTGSTGYCQLRTSYYSTSYKSLNVSLTGSTGDYILSAGATFTAEFKPGRYVYDVKFVYPESVYRDREGSAFIDPNVSKS